MERGQGEKRMASRPKLSLILPAHNEGDIIGKVIDEVDRVVEPMGLDYEIIVVDDGSVDDTRREAANCANNNAHVKVMGYRENLGKGYALKTGFSHATGDFVVFMDSDLDIDPRQVSRYIWALKYGDVIIASKWHPQSSVEMPLMRRFLSHGFNLFVRFLTDVRVKDTQTGLKAVRRKALKRIFSRLAVKRYAFDAELLAVANLYGLKIVELPVNLRMSGLFNLKDVWRMFIDLLGIAYRLKIRKWYQGSSPSSR